jgi:hypothetical protein
MTSWLTREHGRPEVVFVLFANWLPLGTVPVGLLRSYDPADARSLVVDDRHVVSAEKIVERLQDQGLKILVGLQLHHA